MRLIQRLLVFLAYLPASGMIGPRILCTESSGVSSIALAAVRCCDCCDERQTRPSPFTNAVATICGVDDADTCHGCIDVLLRDEAAISRTSAVCLLHVPMVIHPTLLTVRLMPVLSPEEPSAASREGAWPVCPGCVILRV